MHLLGKKAFVKTLGVHSGSRKPGVMKGIVRLITGMQTASYLDNQEVSIAILKHIQRNQIIIKCREMDRYEFQCKVQHSTLLGSAYHVSCN